MKEIKRDELRTQLLDQLHIEEEQVAQYLASEPSNPWLQKIQEAIATHNLETQVLLAGFDENQTAQIAKITESKLTHMRDVNYAVVGSGSIQAVNTLLFQQHSRKTDLPVSVYNVFKAKKNAEAQQGVGNETDIAVLEEGEGIKELSDSDIKELEEVYERELSWGKEHDKLRDLNLAQ
jgi:20S proteasome alpha/beta subunit